MSTTPFIFGEATLESVDWFEGGNILWESDSIWHKFLGIIFYIGETLSRVLIFGCCLPVSEFFKSKALSIVSPKDTLDPLINPMIDPMIAPIMPLIKREALRIQGKYLTNPESISTRDLEDTTIKIVKNLNSEGLTRQELLDRVEPTFIALVQEIEELFDIHQTVRNIPKDEINQRLFFRSVQSQTILRLSPVEDLPEIEELEDESPEEIEELDEGDEIVSYVAPPPQRSQIVRTTISWAPTIVRLAALVTTLYQFYPLFFGETEDPDLPMGRYALS